VGTGDEQDELQRVYLNRKFYLAAHYNKFNAHNQYIQLAIGTGLIGLGLIFIASGWSFWRLRSSRLFLYALTAVLIAMLTESMLETNKGCLIFSIVVSLPFIGGRGEVKLGGGHHAV
jgi:O-antigen ligase